MNAIDLLTQQHVELAELVELFEQARQPQRRIALFLELFDAVVAHAAIEERVFLPAVVDRLDSDPEPRSGGGERAARALSFGGNSSGRGSEINALVRDALAQHRALRTLMLEMLCDDIGSTRFATNMVVLKAQLAQHQYDHEENTLFPRVRAVVGEAELEALGAQMETLFAELIESDPRYAPEPSGGTHPRLSV